MLVFLTFHGNLLLTLIYSSLLHLIRNYSPDVQRAPLIKYSQSLYFTHTVCLCVPNDSQNKYLRKQWRVDLCNTDELCSLWDRTSIFIGYVEKILTLKEDCRRPLTAEAPVQDRASPRDVCGWQSGTVKGFPPSTSGFPCQYHSTNAPYTIVHVNTLS
jgi:hypothetical protein